MKLKLAMIVSMGLILFAAAHAASGAAEQAYTMPQEASYEGKEKSQYILPNPSGQLVVLDIPVSVASEQRIQATVEVENATISATATINESNRTKKLYLPAEPTVSRSAAVNRDTSIVKSDDSLSASTTPIRQDSNKKRFSVREGKSTFTPFTDEEVAAHLAERKAEEAPAPKPNLLASLLASIRGWFG